MIKITSKKNAVGILSLLVGYANAATKAGVLLKEDDGVDAQIFTYFPTFYPTLSPAPTASSAPSPFCDDGMNVEVKIKTDKYPGKTTWTLQRNGCEGMVEISGGPYLEENTLYRAEKCLPLGNYIFTINDSFGDGLGTVNGDGTDLFYKPFGFYEVNVDGVTTISGGEFPFVYQTQFIWNKCPASKAGKASSKARKSGGSYSIEGGNIAGLSLSMPSDSFSM